MQHALLVVPELAEENGALACPSASSRCHCRRNSIRRARTRKQKESAFSSMALLVGFPAPCPAFVSTRISSGFVCKERRVSERAVLNSSAFFN